MLLCGTCFETVVIAQTPAAASLDDLGRSGPVKQGDPVLVIDVDGRRTSGRVAEIASDRGPAPLIRGMSAARCAKSDDIARATTIAPVNESSRIMGDSLPFYETRQVLLTGPFTKDPVIVLPQET
jgi:hypothetical protein